MKPINSILRPLAIALSLLTVTRAAQTVSTPTDLAAAITAANASSSASTINLAGGTYALTTNLPDLAANGLTLQGPTDPTTPAILDADKLPAGVIFNVTANQVTIANLALRNARTHAIAIQPGADSGLIEKCTFSNPTTPLPTSAAIDGNGCADWVVTGNSISGIVGTTATAEPAIHFYGGAAGTEITNNLILNCDRAITLGAATIVNTAPAITTQPASITVAVGQTATFTVVATGVPTPTYQWRKNGTNISSATSASYTTPATTTTDNAALFSVVVSNSAGTATSVSATLTVTSTVTAPVIAYSPMSYNLTVGTTITAIAPASTGGAVTSWSIAPTLPAGLSFNASTGAITGTPTAASSATSYTVTATNAAGSGTAALSITSVATSNPTPIAITFSTSRVSGVAPLSIFFDATGTNATATSRPFHDLEYRWDFGDATSGAWTYGSNPAASSKNRATGAVSAHVFETPGTYSVTLSVTDGTNTDTRTVSITVTDPDVAYAGNTTCISATTDFTGSPAGATLVTDTSFNQALKTAIPSGAKRILFKRGDTFTVTASTYIPTSSGIQIGAFGSGNRPLVRITTTSEYAIASGVAAVVTDCRVMDLEIDGQLLWPANRALNIVGQDVLALRVYAHDTGYGFAMGGTNMAIVDCQVLRIPGINGGNMPVFLGSVFGLFVAGCSIDNNGGGEYNLRYQGGTRGVIIHNTFKHCGDGKSMLTLRGDGTALTDLTHVFYITQYHMIADNFFDGSSNVGVIGNVSIVPQNSARNEPISDVIFERNISNVGTSNQEHVNINACDVTVRNNLFDGSNSSNYAVLISYSGNTAGLRVPARNHVYNNTFMTTASLSVTGVGIWYQGQKVIDTEIRNNFMYAPNATKSGELNAGPLMIYDAGTNTIASNNSTNAQVKTALPTLTTVPPVVPGDWTLAPGCYGIDAGAAVPVWSDFFLTPLNPATPRNLGAIEN